MWLNEAFEAADLMPDEPFKIDDVIRSLTNLSPAMLEAMTFMEGGDLLPRSPSETRDVPEQTLQHHAVSPPLFMLPAPGTGPASTTTARSRSPRRATRFGSTTGCEERDNTIDLDTQIALEGNATGLGLADDDQVCEDDDPVREDHPGGHHHAEENAGPGEDRRAMGRHTVQGTGMYG